ncbi:MAG: LPS export ABC transporter permease LptG [Alphaproteobacteria bacterium]|nr:MAG: LPS export ABC transporter permease LptG [Alphaproteobacteria bacterium]
MTFILARYLARHMFFNVLIAFGVVLAIAGLIDLVEIFRRTANKEAISLMLTLKMAMLRLPHLGEKLLPYSVLIGTMMALMKLTRSSELVIVRSAGVSVWKFLTPALVLSAGLGCFSLMVLNPLAAASLAYYERLETRYILGSSELFSLSSSGLWLRHVDERDGATFYGTPIHSYILQAAHIAQSDMSLNRVIIFLQDKNAHFIGRIDADRALLQDRQWHIQDAMLSAPGRVPLQHEQMNLPTELSIRQIQDSFAEPRTLSFWQLSSFIETLEKAGFSALRHKIHWYSILLSPFVFVAMVMLAALFSLRQPRRGKLMLMVFGAVVTGFFLNFVSGLFHAFGYSGELSIEVAVFAPQLLSVLISMLILLHVEDG